VHACCGVLSHLDSSAIEAPCVLASHVPSTPHRRVVIQLDVLSAAEHGLALGARPDETHGDVELPFDELDVGARGVR
jgi:hypothetical protein